MAVGLRSPGRPRDHDASIVCRGDRTVTVQLMASYVTRWTTEDDRAMERLMAYIRAEANLRLLGTLSPADLGDARLIVWPDADWNGDHRTTKGTSGSFLELCTANPDHRFPICWKTAHQGSTASSSAEGETVSLSSALRHSAFPVQSLLIEMLGGQRVPMEAKVDNAQALCAIRDGYSKKLRFLPRTQRCSIGVLHEALTDPDADLTASYTPTADQKGDFFTKSLGVVAFRHARDMFGLMRPPRAPRLRF